MEISQLLVVCIVSSFLLNEVTSNAQDELNETNDLLSTPAEYGSLFTKAAESSPETHHVSKDITVVPTIDNNTQSTEIFHFEPYVGSGSGSGSGEWYNTVLPHHRDDHHHVHDTDHYSVAKLDFESVSFPFYVSLWLLSACLAKIGMYYSC